MRMRPLAREIGVALIFKLIALIALYALFFGPAHRIKVTPEEMTHMLSSPSATR